MDGDWLLFNKLYNGPSPATRNGTVNSVQARLKVWTPFSAECRPTKSPPVRFPLMVSVLEMTLVAAKFGFTTTRSSGNPASINLALENSVRAMTGCKGAFKNRGHQVGTTNPPNIGMPHQARRPNHRHAVRCDHAGAGVNTPVILIILAGNDAMHVANTDKIVLMVRDPAINYIQRRGHINGADGHTQDVYFFGAQIEQNTVLSN